MQKIAKNSPSAHHYTTLLHCRAVSSQPRHVSTIGKKLVKQQYPPTCPNEMANFGPLTADIGLPVWGTSANFNGFRVLASLLHRRRSTNVNQTLHNVRPSPALIHVYTFSGILHPDLILPGAKFTLHPNVAFSYIGSVTVRHSNSRRQPNFAAWCKEWNYGTFA